MQGVENLEYVEIYNPSAATVNLDGWNLEFINGSNGQPYKTISLGDGMLRPSQYLVVGDPAVGNGLPDNTIFIAIESSGNDHDFQNGSPDGVRIIGGNSIGSVSYDEPLKA